MHAPGEHHVHVVAGALKHFDVALLLAEDHVLVMLLLRRGVGRGLRVHLDEGFSAWLTLG